MGRRSRTPAKVHRAPLVLAVVALGLGGSAVTASAHGHGFGLSGEYPHGHQPDIPDTTTSTQPGVTTTTGPSSTTTSSSPTSSTTSSSSTTTTTTSPPTTTTTTAPAPPAPPASGGSLAAPAGYATKIFEDTFSGSSLDESKWNPYITSRAANGWPWNSNGSGGSGDNAGGFNSEYYEPSAINVDNGLTLSATSGSSRAGYTWTSGAISSYGKFQFDGGYVQIRAKMPSGDGMWPGLWMLPGPGGTNGDDNEIDLFEGNFTGTGASPADNFAWHLITSSGKGGGVTNAGADLAAGYHTYGLAWVPGQSITWYLDGAQVGRITSAQLSIPNEPMELIVTLAVANSTASGWRTAYDASTPSPSTMEISDFQVWQ